MYVDSYCCTTQGGLLQISVAARHGPCSDACNYDNTTARCQLGSRPCPCYKLAQDARKGHAVAECRSCRDSAGHTRR
jgi:hypothetical protein